MINNKALIFSLKENSAVQIEAGHFSYYSNFIKIQVSVQSTHLPQNCSTETSIFHC